MEKYVFWNNKGGTGKTGLVFQLACRYADLNKNSRILVIDLCPQANLSELMLGGQENDGGRNLLAAYGRNPRCSIGGYFEARFASPFSPAGFRSKDYILTPHQIHDLIPENIDLLCGDPLLELQSIAMNALANTAIPGVNTWLAIIDWLKDLLEQISGDYDIAILDTNPSFSICTQIALAASEKIILPVTADESSRRAVQNALSLIYGIRLPSPAYSKYTFSSHILDAGRDLPKVHLVVKNKLTRYMGEDSAYGAVLSSISTDLADAVASHPRHFTFSQPADGLLDIRDFQMVGAVSFARGCPVSQIPAGKLTIGGHRVQVKREQKDDVLQSIDDLARKLIS